MLPIVLIILWLWPSSLYAQSEALMDAYNQGQALYEAGRYEQAIPLFRKALELGEQEFGPNHSTTALLLDNLAHPALLWDKSKQPRFSVLRAGPL